MEPVNKLGSKNIYGTSVKPTAKQGNSESFKMVQTDLLLKGTGQYGKWLGLRQKNVGKAEKLAEFILKRHDLIDDAKAGKSVDIDTFDSLTREIKKYGILLFNGRQMKNVGYKWAENIKEKIIPPAVKEPVPAGIDVPKEAVNKEAVNKEAAGPGEVNSVNQFFEDENELILEVKYKDSILSQGILAENKNGKILYPIRSIAGILHTELKKEGQGIYSGKTYGNEKVKFDFNRGEIQRGKEVFLFSKDEFLNKDGEDYISSKVFKNIYGSDLKLNYSEMQVELQTDKSFPVIEEIERSNRRVFSQNRNRFNPDYPEIDQSYSMYRDPIVDFQTNYGWNSNEDDNPDYDYSIRARGELLKSGVSLYAKGNEDESPDRIELTAERVNPKKESPFDPTRVAVGDIRHDGFSVFGSTGTEKGIRIESKNLNRTADFDSTDFRGNLASGWDIELYRGNILIGKQNSNETGQFEFDDVPLFFGENKFKLVYYGPFGEKREEEKVIRIDSSLEKPGELSYDFSISKKSEDTISFKDELNPKDYGSPRISANFSTGLGNKFGLQGGFRSEEIDEKRHNYLSMGFRGSLSGVLMSNDFAVDSAGGQALNFSAQTRVKDINVRVKETLYNDFEKDSNSDRVKSNSELSLAGVFFESSKFPISWSMDESYTSREDSFSNSFRLRQGLSIDRFSLYNSTAWNNNSFSTNNDVSGNLDFYKKIDKGEITISSSYDVLPKTRIKQISVSGDREIGSKSNFGIGVSQDFEAGKTGFNASLGYDNGKIKMSPSLSIDTEGDFKIFTSVGVSAGKDPHTEKYDMDSSARSHYGEVSALVYNDENNNGKKDTGEKPLSDIRLESTGTGLYAETDENGIAVLKGLSPNRKQNIHINEDYIEDPFLISSKEGVGFHPRSGRIEKVEFPLFSSGEISGTVFSFNENGEKNILAYEKINVVSKDGKINKEIYSEFDGYYSLDRLPPGEYQLLSGNGGDVYEYRENISVKTSDVNSKDIIMVKKEVEIEPEKSLKKPLYSKLLFNEENIEIKNPVNNFSPMERIPDKTILFYEDGSWLFGNENQDGYGVHVASFDNAGSAREFIEQTNEKLDEKLVIKKTQSGDKDWYRVICGNYEKRDLAEGSLDKIYAVTGYTSILNYS